MKPIDLAKAAAELLNATDASGPVLKVFFDNLEPITHGELVSRAADEPDRN